MPRVTRLFLFGVVVVACGGTSSIAEPRTPTSRSSGIARSPADDLVRHVQAVYANTQHLTVKFRQTVSNETFGLPSVSDGRLYFERPGKLRWHYVSRSTRAAGNLHRSGGTAPVAILFLADTGSLSKDFTARLLTGSKHGAGADKVLELAPKNPSVPYKALVLVVDPSNFRIKKSIVTSATGDTNELSFHEPDMTAARRRDTARP